MHGTEDEQAPYPQMQRMERRMRELGVRCEFRYYDGVRHGFAVRTAPGIRAEIVPAELRRGPQLPRGTPAAMNGHEETRRQQGGPGMSDPLTGPLDAAETLAFVRQRWDEDVLPALARYVEIPAKSPAFDPDWARHGHLDRAVALIEDWARGRPLAGLAVETVRLPGRTPLILVETAGASPDTILLYGHCDKQPEMTGWVEGLGPWTAVRRGDRLYGRGAHDDGYAAFCALTAIEAVRRAGAPHARCVVLIEACEESGSADLPAYLEALAPRLGAPDLVICLDSGCGNYEQLWGTTSLRGLVNGVLTVDVLTEGVHSGTAGGIVPSSFRIARQLLSRVEDERTGVVARDFHVEVPAARTAEARAVAGVLGADLAGHFPLVPGMRAAGADPTALLLASTWEPALAVIGADGLPALADGGNVLRPRTALKLSLRLPPTLDAAWAAGRLRELLEADPPYGARVSFTPAAPAGGWDAPPTEPWLLAAQQSASERYFGKPAMFVGIGGTIPFMAMLGERFPRAQFFITGTGGPGSNAHGPNEFLHLPTAERLTACVADVIAAHHRARRG
jgi:acetylornithine deacetylase/succinyl-diaminopimelate desuccinylase-like protein